VTTGQDRSSGTHAAFSAASKHDGHRLRHRLSTTTFQASLVMVRFCFRDACRPYSIGRRVDRRLTKHRVEASRGVAFYWRSPGVCNLGVEVAHDVEHMNCALPYRPAIERFCHGLHALKGCGRTKGSLYGRLQFRNANFHVDNLTQSGHLHPSPKYLVQCPALVFHPTEWATVALQLASGITASSELFLPCSVVTSEKKSVLRRSADIPNHPMTVPTLPRHVPTHWPEVFVSSPSQAPCSPTSPSAGDHERAGGQQIGA
jgi:hypothetical protein